MVEETQDAEEIIERVAALDVGKAELVCCARVPGGTPGRRAQEVQTYSTMTRSLLAMSGPAARSQALARFTWSRACRLPGNANWASRNAMP